MSCRHTLGWLAEPPDKSTVNLLGGLSTSSDIEVGLRWIGINRLLICFVLPAGNERKHNLKKQKVVGRSLSCPTELLKCQVDASTHGTCFRLCTPTTLQTRHILVEHHYRDCRCANIKIQLLNLIYSVQTTLKLAIKVAADIITDLHIC